MGLSQRALWGKLILCEITLNMGQWFKRCCLKIFLALALVAILLSKAGPCAVQVDGTWVTFVCYAPLLIKAKFATSIYRTTVIIANLVHKNQVCRFYLSYYSNIAYLVHKSQVCHFYRTKLILQALFMKAKFATSIVPK